MTQLGWKTLAAALLVLAAGLARAEEPSRAPTSAKPCPGCPTDCTGCPSATEQIFHVRFTDSGCCSQASGRTSANATSGCCCATEEPASCCCSKSKSTCCADCGKGCACCAKAKAQTAAGCACCGSSSCCCAKAEKSCCCGEAKGCSCCVKAKAAADCSCCGKGKCCCAASEQDTPNTPAKGKKNVTVIVLPLPPPLPGGFPMPAPPVCFTEPLPAAPFYRGGPVPPPAIAVAPPAPAPAYVCPGPGPLPPPEACYQGGPFQPTGFIAPPAPPAPPVCCVPQPSRTEGHGCSLHVVTEDGVDSLEIHSGNDARMVCDHLTLKVAGHKSVKAAVADKQVVISSPVLKAKADRISVGAAEDRIILDGHVQMEYRLSGAEERCVVNASHVVLNLAHDQFEIMAAGALRTQTKAALPAAAQDVFDFWTGFCR
jgi:hypothetical protein